MAQGFGNLGETKPTEVDDADANADFCSAEGGKDIRFSLTEPPCTGDTEAVDTIGHDAATSKSKKTVKVITILPPPPFANQDNESEMPSLSGRHKLCILPHFRHILEDCDLSDCEDGLTSSVYCTVKRKNIRYADLEELKTFAVSPLGNEKSEPTLCLLQNSLLGDKEWKDNIVFHSFATSSGRFGPSIDILLQDEKTKKKFLMKKVIGGIDICQEMETLSRVQHPNVDRLMGFLHANSERWLMFNTNGVSLSYYSTKHPDFPRDQLELCRVFEGVLSGTAALHDKGMEHWNLDPAHLCYDGSTVKIKEITDNFPDFRTEPDGMYASPEIARYILLNTQLVPEKEQVKRRIKPTELQDISAGSHIYLAALVYLYIQSGHHPLVDVVTGGKDWETFVRSKRDMLSLQLLQMVADLPDVLQQSLKNFLNGIDRSFQGLLQRMLKFEADRRPTLTQALKETEEILVWLTRNANVNEEAGPIFGHKRTHHRDSLLEEHEGHNAVLMNENPNHFWESKKDDSCPSFGNIQRGQRDKLSHPTQRRSIQTCGNIPHFSFLFNTEPK